MAELTLSNVGKTYPGGVTAVTGADFVIADGEFIVLVGPSGCGKSTILRMIAGLEEITTGEVSIAGRVVNRLEPGERDIAMVFQNYALYPHMSVRRNMEYGLRNQGMRKDEITRRIAEAARMLQIEQVSRPQSPARSRAASVSASPWAGPSCAKPAVFLFDEPLSKPRRQAAHGSSGAELKDLHTRLRGRHLRLRHPRPGRGDELSRTGS